MHSKARIWSSVIFSLCFLTVLHGFSILKIIGLISINYQLTKYLGSSKMLPVLIWIYGISLLFLNFSYKGYKFGSISSIFNWMDRLEGDLKSIITGLGIRWYISFNFSMLRMISFSMDYYWSLSSNRNETFLKDSNLSERERTETHCDDYGYLNYMTYIVY